MSTINKLFERMLTSGTLACCGLDPNPACFPSDVVSGSKNEAEQTFHFLRRVVHTTSPHVCAYKVQKAFFDAIDGGHEVLAEILQLIRQDYPDIPIFLDCKIGDIDNTMTAYARLVFDKLGADGVLVNPYMGDDVFEAFAGYEDRAIVVLARTSNPGAAIVQDSLMSDGRPLWQYMLSLIVQRWNTRGNLIPVFASTATFEPQPIRSLIPDGMPILLAGIGAQGGTLSGLSQLTNSQGVGVFVNSSRGILYPKESNARSWEEQVAQAVISFKASLNEARGQA